MHYRGLHTHKLKLVFYSSLRSFFFFYLGIASAMLDDSCLEYSFDCCGVSSSANCCSILTEMT